MEGVSMSSNESSLINKSAIDYIYICLQNNNLYELQDMGFAREDILLLKDMKAADLMRMSKAGSNFLDIRVNRERLHFLVNYLQEDVIKSEYVEKFIKAGASQSMLESLFAITGAEYTAIRKLLGMGNKGVGRAKVANEEQSNKIYHKFQKFNKSVEQLQPDDWLQMQQQLNLPMRLLWSTLSEVQNGAAK